MRRRFLLFASPLVLIACQATTPATPGTPAPDLAGALRFAVGVKNLLIGTGGQPGLIQAVAAAAAGAIPGDMVARAIDDITAAGSILAGITAATPSGIAVTGLQSVEAYFNAGLEMLGGFATTVPSLARYAPLIDAATVGVQMIELFINAQLGASGAAAPEIPVAVPAEVPGNQAGVTRRTARMAQARDVVSAMRATARRNGMTREKAAGLLKVTP